MTKFIVRFVQTILQDAEVDIKEPVLQRVTVLSPAGTYSICAYCRKPIVVAPQLDVYGSSFGDVLQFHEKCYEMSIFDCESPKSERER